MVHPVSFAFLPARREQRVVWHALLTGALFGLGSFTSSGCDNGSGSGSDPDEPRYAVGTAAYEWTDESRPELFTDDPDDHRIVPVRAWYPARASSSDRAPYFLQAQQAERTAVSNGMPADTFTNVQLPARVGAALSGGSARFPVLIFSPGLSTPPELYGYQLADLASHGYVVFALAHPYASGDIVLSDGTVAPELPEDPGAYGARDRSVATWSQDQRFVLSRVQELAKRGSGDRMSGRLDLAHVGAFGHSRGGAAAAESCLEDARFSACANLDGSVSSKVLANPISSPFLLMRSEVNDGTLEPFFAGLTGPAHLVRIPTAGHNSFSDLPRLVRDLQLPLDAESLLLGSLDADRAFEINAAYLDAFFGAELRARDAASFFEAAPFEEAEVTEGGSLASR